MSEKAIRWGIMGPGHIARKFAEALQATPGAEITAAASHSQERAESFKKDFGLKYAFTSYAELISCAEVDIIYIATTHNFHHENIKACLSGGKPVLCEKPFTVNAAQAEEVFNLAKEKKLFLMEAMWTRFLPNTVKMLKLIQEGTIGEIKFIRACFGINIDGAQDHRLMRPELGGGCLLDLGIYPISFNNFIFQDEPKFVQSTMYKGETGVDEATSCILDYGDGRQSVLQCSLNAQNNIEALVCGTKGRLRVPHFLSAQKFYLTLQDDEEEKEYSNPLNSTGLGHQAEEAMRCLREGKLESRLQSATHSISRLRLMDSIREKHNYKYPFE